MDVHERIDDLSALAAAGALDEAERGAVDAHAASCPACAAALAEARDFHRWASGALAVDRAPDGLEDRLVARLALRRRARAGLRFVRPLAVVAALLGLVWLGAWFSGADGLELYDVQDLTYGMQDMPGSDVKLQQDEIRLKLTESLQREMRRRVSEAEAASPAELKRLEEARARAVVEALDPGLAVERDVAEKKRFYFLEENANPPATPAPASSQPRRAVGAAEDLTVDEFAATTGGAFAPLPSQAGQKLVRNGRLALEVASYEETQAELVTVVAEEKGFVAGAETERLQNGKIRATVTLRVPAERFDAALGRIRALGTVKSQSVTAEDVTKAFADLESRLSAKQAFLERLKKVLADGKGGVKELLEVEVQIGQTLEEIDRLKGELKFYENRIALSTIVLQIAERDLGRPFEVVETLQSRIGLVALEAESLFATARTRIQEAGGQVADARLTRQSDGTLSGSLRARVDAAKFPEIRAALRSLGHVELDTLEQQSSGHGGHGMPAGADAPVRREQAVVDLTVATPPLHVSRRAQLTVETADVDAAYGAARKAVEAAGGRILEGQLHRQPNVLTATLKAQVDGERQPGLVEALRSLGAVKEQGGSQTLPPPTALVREKGEVELTLRSPPALIAEEEGLGRTVRDTLARSFTGVLWSAEKLVVGLALAAPWIAAAALGWLLWRRRRRKTAAEPAAPVR